MSNAAALPPIGINFPILVAMIHHILTLNRWDENTGKMTKNELWYRMWNKEALIYA